MVTKFIELSDIADTEALARIITDGEGDLIILRHGGQDIARVTAIAPTNASSSDPVPAEHLLTEVEREQLLSLDGAWADLVDFDAWDRARADQRAMPTRPHVDWDDSGDQG